MKIFINQGKIIADEKTDELSRAIEDNYLYQIKICGPQKDVLAAVSKIQGVKSITPTGERDADSYAYLVESDKGIDVRKPIFTLCAQKSWAILGLNPTGTDLETIFIRLVDRSEGVEPEPRRRKTH